MPLVMFRTSDVFLHFDQLGMVVRHSDPGRRFLGVFSHWEPEQELWCSSEVFRIGMMLIDISSRYRIRPHGLDQLWDHTHPLGPSCTALFGHGRIHKQT